MITWIIKIIRSIFLLIDQLVYWVLELVYQLFMMIAQSTIFGPETIQAFATRIYVLLGIIMLFRVALAMVNYIVNPDSFSDAKQGGVDLIKKLVIVLVGIIAVPFAFEAAFALQRIVLHNNVIGTVILGGSAPVGDREPGDFIKEGGRMMSFQTFSAFYRIEESIVGSDSVCHTITYPLESWVEACTADIQGVYPSTARYVAETFAEAHDRQDFRILARSDISGETVRAEGRDVFVIDYMFGISTISGGFIVWILIGFCIDIAVRAIKLGFLQLIAPIPLVSYLAPGEKGKKTLSNWVSTCGKTYVDIFIRLAAIFFVVFVITEIVRYGVTDVLTGEPVTNPFVIVFIIIGALMFAKQFPDLLKDILGIDLGGKGFSLNPMKKIREGAMFGDKIANTAGLIGRSAKNLGAAGLTASRKGLSMGAKKIGSGINTASGGRIEAGLHTMGTPFRAMGRGMRNAGAAVGRGISAADRFSGGHLRDIKDDAADYGSDMSQGVRGALGIGQQAAKRHEKNQEALKAVSEAAGNLKSRAEEKAMKRNVGYIEAQGRYEALQKAMQEGKDTYTFHDRNGNLVFGNANATEMANVIAAKESALDRGIEEEIDMARAGTGDAAVMSAFDAAKGTYDEYSSTMSSIRYTDRTGEVVDAPTIDFTSASTTSANIRSYAGKMKGAVTEYGSSKEAQMARNVPKPKTK